MQGYRGASGRGVGVWDWESDGLFFVCMDCGTRAADKTGCPKCGSSPLLDLREPAVREACAKDDQRLEQKRNEKVRYGAVVGSLVLVVGGSFAFPPLGVALLGIGPFFSGYIITLIMVAAAIIAVFKFVFPYRRRFPYVPGL